MKKSYAAIVTALVLSFLALRPVSAQGLADVINNSYAAEAAKDFAGAIKALKAVEATEGSNYIYRLRLGWLSYLAGMWNESIAQYQSAAAIAPEAVEPLQGMLNPLVATGKTADIAKTHEAILNLDPNNYTSLKQSAWLAYTAKNYKKAASYYARILKLYPTDVEMMLGLGYSLKLSGNKAGAERTFNTVLLLSPRNARALAGLQ